MKILILDNYDSFTFNLMHAIEGITGESVDVARNDKISIEQAANYDKIVLSPGPGIPDEAGILKELIRILGPSKSIFGVCLGMQAIAEVYHGKLVKLEKVYHGVSTEIKIVQKEALIFSGIKSSFSAGRYHSWAVEKESLPPELIVTAEDSQGAVMALRHSLYDVQGVQFHPESILTPEGLKIIANWLNINSYTKDEIIFPNGNDYLFASLESMPVGLMC